MATRSRIGILQKDGTVKSIYCHFDGYPSGVGETLMENYDTKEKIEELLNLGDLSSLGLDIEDSIFYNRDREEDWEQVKPANHINEEKFIKDAQGCWAEYAYLFKEDEWKVFSVPYK